ncbi:MAG: hypothetical protein MZV63_55320 [Marinilabiliales bacterium]|nr:hypothetical protein [Marinilabiliales bacterium]
MPLHRISKYKGKDEYAAADKQAWAQEPGRSSGRPRRRGLRTLRRDLIQTVRTQESMSGSRVRFSPDSYLQRELEASFIYEDTPDQLSSTVMRSRKIWSRRHPMDRLVCGDVGFGKTEVASKGRIQGCHRRQADGSACAYNNPCPHNTIRHSLPALKDFPCKVDYISRHRKPAEQKRILSQIADGEIDIIVGTHKITGQGGKVQGSGTACHRRRADALV